MYVNATCTCGNRVAFSPSRIVASTTLFSMLLLAIWCLAAIGVAGPAFADKPFPSDASREWTCPPNWLRGAPAPAGFHRSISDLNAVHVNHSLVAIVPEVAELSNIAVILVKRRYHLDGRQDVVFRYFGNGEENFAIETWSSSKIFSAMNGAGHLKSMCSAEPRAGLPQSTSGDYGVTPLGDLVTIIVTYDTTHPPYSSNALGGWFEMVGGRDRAVWLVDTWLNRTGESIGANYGNPPPTDLTFNFTNPGPCNITPDSADNGDNSNTLSALTAAELVKRIALVREAPDEALPNTTWADTKQLFYGAGATASRLFPGRVWGGMSANDADSLRLGVNITDMESRSRGRYRTFSKDGAGYSFIRLAGELLFNGYACYPVVGPRDDPSIEVGVEYFVSSRVSVPGDRTLSKASVRFVAAMTALNQAILAGKLS